MSRTILAGGRVFDGTGAPVRDADVVIEAGRIVDVGAGLVPGPRLQISVTLLSQTGGHGDGWFASGQQVRFWPVYPGVPDGLVDGPEQLRRKVRELVRAGADVIKVATTGGVLSATDDPRHAHFREDELAALVAEAAEVSEAHADSFRRAVAAGVKVAMGTDSGVTSHGRNLAELELMAKGGMAPAAVRQATTASAAAALTGLEAELGTLEPGKRADVVAVDGDPFELATLPDRIAAVWQDGRLVAGRA